MLASKKIGQGDGGEGSIRKPRRRPENVSSADAQGGNKAPWLPAVLKQPARSNDDTWKFHCNLLTPVTVSPPEFLKGIDNNHQCD